MDPSPATHWYYVAADFKCTHPGTKQRRHLWERSVFVFQSTMEAAEATALKVARSHEHEYLNPMGELVRWVFVGIESWSELFAASLDHGTEVYWDWRFSTDQPKNFRRLNAPRVWEGKRRAPRRRVRLESGGPR